MPGGIGPVSGEVERSLRRGSRQTGLGSDATPVQIFYNLGIGQVHYLDTAQLMYFVESATVSVLELVQQACQSLSSQPLAEQLFLDRHGFIKGAYRMQLTTEQARVILVALRLSGIRISLAKK